MSFAEGSDSLSIGIDKIDNQHRQSVQHTITIDQDRCTRCESCVDVCVRRIYESTGDNITLTDPAKCIVCGHCMAICPTDAIRLSVVNPDEFEPIQKISDSPDPDRLMGLFRRRRSVRRFQERPVEREKIEKIIEAGRFAPTGGNLQPFRFSVVQTPEVLQYIKKMVIGSFVEKTARDDRVLAEKIERGEALSAAENMQHAYAERWRANADALDRGVDRLLYHAPALISLYVPAVFTQYSVTEAGCVVGLTGMQMVLMAESLGLGTCFIGYIAGSSVGIANSLPEVKKAMNIPEDYAISLAFVVGYSDFDYLRSVSRKPARISWA